MRVLLAFDKFKGSLTAAEACAAGARAAEAGGHTPVRVPLSDGGEGFCALLTELAGGRLVETAVTGPRGESRVAAFGVVDADALPRDVGDMLFGAERPPARVGVVELAAASGLGLVPADQRDPRRMTTRGTGDLIRAAAAAGCGAVVVGLGGSATHDLGLGILAACGLRFEGSSGEDLGDLPAEAWARLTRVVAPTARFPIPVVAACDVDNPLTGPRGAARVFGPQKGLPVGDIAALDAAGSHVAWILARDLGLDPVLAEAPGAGAAGGAGFGLMAGLGARIVPGFGLFATWAGLDRRIAEADVVVTGEGSFDRGSLGGKGPCGVVRRAQAVGRRAAVFAGSVEPGIEASLPGVAVRGIHEAGDRSDGAFVEAAARLERAVAAWLRSLT